MTLAPAIAALITVVLALVTLNNWRWGLIGIIFIGVLQDVLRKMTPDVPSYYIIWSMAMFGGVVMVAAVSRSMGNVRDIWFGDKTLKSAFYLYFFLITIHLIHSLVRWGAPALPIFGAIFYFGPVLALVLVIGFSKDMRWMERFIRWYLLVMVPVSLTVYLSPLLMESVPVLREVGSFVGAELIIYDVGTILHSYSGLLRVGEIAAFHAATCAALLSMLLYLGNESLFRRISYVLVIVALIGVIVMTGRRKMLMTLTIFWVAQFFFLNVLRKGLSRRVIVVGALGLTIAFGLGAISQGESSVYLTRGASVFGSVGGRVEASIDLFQSALVRSSWLGLGAGAASSGTRYAGVEMFEYVGGSSESGIGYLAVELGIPGVLVIAWLVFNLAKVLWQRLKVVARISDAHLVRAVSYLSFLLANVATFATATQLYGDYFVLIILGVVAGGLYTVIHDAYNRQLLSQLLVLQAQGEKAPE